MRSTTTPATDGTTAAQDLSLSRIGALLDTYAEALSTGDVSEVAACFALPAMVLREGGAAVACRREDVVAAIAALERLRQPGDPPAAVPHLRRVEDLGGGLVSADVLWHGVDERGHPAGGQERYVYLIRSEGGEPRIHVAVGPLAG